jgi:signal transduction histidine kinase
MDAVADQDDGRRVVTVTARQTGGFATVQVTDRGHGIEPDNLHKLFDSFFSTKPTGIGLGLSIVRTLVESHGGKVWAENRPSGGAVFNVELPAVRKMARAEVA